MRVVADAPAKLNLGLEVLGRRPDGFHEVVTILQAVTRFDRLALEPAPDLRLDVSDPALAGPDNLALVALRALQDRTGTAACASVRIEKTIPTAAGLGGASSDAAAALLAGRRLWDVPAPDADLAALAATLGSDVPFFLAGGTALATGRGERIEPLPAPPPAWFVVVAPNVAIPRKTATLYAALTEADFTSGEGVRRQAARLRSGRALDPDLLTNAFRRPLSALRPELPAVAAAMRRAGAPFVALSGAGPAHYTAVSRPEEAAAMATTLAATLGEAAVVFACEPAGAPRVRVVAEASAQPTGDRAR